MLDTRGAAQKTSEAVRKEKQDKATGSTRLEEVSPLVVLPVVCL